MGNTYKKFECFSEVHMANLALFLIFFLNVCSSYSEANNMLQGDKISL